MSSFTIAGICLLVSIGLIWVLDKWIGGGPAKFHDLTRPPEFVDQAERQPTAPRPVNNELAVSLFRTRWEAGGHNVRPLPVRPEPQQIASWEDDGGTTPLKTKKYPR